MMIREAIKMHNVSSFVQNIGADTSELYNFYRKYSLENLD